MKQKSDILKRNYVSSARKIKTSVNVHEFVLVAERTRKANVESSIKTHVS